MKNIPYSKEQLMRANMKLMEQNKRYKQALEFYTDEDLYEFETIVSDCDIEVESKILEDGGRKARQALKNDTRHVQK